jgi:hypothetical protein
MVVQWFQQQPRQFFAEIHLLVGHSDACLNTLGDFFNGLYSFCQNNPQSRFI